jgi:hypothetical protein
MFIHMLKRAEFSKLVPHGDSHSLRWFRTPFFYLLACKFFLLGILQGFFNWLFSNEFSHDSLLSVVRGGSTPPPPPSSPWGLHLTAAAVVARLSDAVLSCRVFGPHTTNRRHETSPKKGLLRSGHRSWPCDAFDGHVYGHCPVLVAFRGEMDTIPVRYWAKVPIPAGPTGWFLQLACFRTAREQLSWCDAPGESP